MKTNFKILGVMVVLLLCGASGKAQNVTTPYSMYGYGILGDRATSMQRQMGGVGIAMNSGRQINVMNPASYAAIDSLTFLFDIGADVSMLWQSESRNGKTIKEKSTGGGLDYITMQFPICKFMGGSIGLLPYSSVGYAFGSDISHGTMENQGSGGINMAYLGLAGKYAGFSLGVNVSYNFGNIINDVYSKPTTAGGSSSLFEHVMQIRDWDINVGLQYNRRVGKFHKIGVGLTWAPKKSLHGNSWAAIQETSQDSRADTIGTMNLKGKYYTPMSWGVGLSYAYERDYRISGEIDFIYQEWSKATYSPLYSDKDPDEALFQGMKFDNRSRISAGLEYVPRLRGNYLQRMAYRFGGYYTRDYINILGNGVREYGITAGFGFPTIEGKTIINLGLEWKRRLTSPKNLISENYFNVTLGVNFNELWFWQRKIR